MVDASAPFTDGDVRTTIPRSIAENTSRLASGVRQAPWPARYLPLLGPRGPSRSLLSARGSALVLYSMVASVTETPRSASLVRQSPAPRRAYPWGALR